LWFAIANWLVFTIALIGVCTLIAYENGLKADGITGNIAVGFMSGAVFLYAGMAVNNPGPTIWMFGLAFLATISREIVKDIQDLEGDRDRRTLPSRIGISYSLNTLANAVMLFGIYNARKEDYFMGQKNIKQGMGIAMLAFIVAAGFS
jgi:geranylgeranylglycerol-phosphate geranylgeranyltransferase